MNIINKLFNLLPFYKRKENADKCLIIPAVLALTSPKFQLKNLLNSFYKSFYIFAFKPFGIGDHVKIGQQEGIVYSVDVNYIVINKKDRVLYVPTESVYNNVIEVFKR